MNQKRWQQIEALYHSALELEPSERDVLLDEACTGDAELRREVELLLRQPDDDNVRTAAALQIAAQAMAQDAGQSFLGKEIGAYKILSLLGVGGMGEVYRAKDLKLGREVAIKVLPRQFAQDAERLSRFKREAKVLALLNHPNVAAIYGLEEFGGIQFLVLELVEGETLAERVATNPPAVHDALKIGMQIADALEAAHKKGVTHRDVKPANIKVTPEGCVKVLDFGLAKAFADEHQDSAIVATLSATPTEDGRILGTPAYMSPEQAQGKPVDKQTDIWAFGCVLYELLTAKRAFPGENITQTIAAVLRSEPDWQALPPQTPNRVREMLQRCLEKEPGRRRRDIGDIRLDLEMELNGASKTERVVTVAPSKPWRQKMLWGVGGLALLVLGGAAVWSLKPAPAQPVMHLNMNLAPSDRLTELQCPIVTLSPDGTRVAFIGIREGKRQLFLRALNSPEEQPVSGTEGAFCTPAFSPDGQWLAFYSDGKLQKVPYTGGTPIVLASIGGMAGVSWGDDDKIIFSSSFRGLQRVSASGGDVEFVTTTDTQKGEMGHTFPQVLPGAHAILYTVVFNERPDESQIVAQRIDTGERRVLVQGGTYPNYVQAGYLVFLRSGTMMAVSFDPDRLQIGGTPVPAGEQVLQSDRGAAQFGISRLGSLVYVPGGENSVGQLQLRWVDRKGTEEALEAPPRGYELLKISPDGSRVVIGVVGPRTTLWVFDLKRGTLSNLGVGDSPVWTRDGDRVIFGNSGHIVSKPADGSSAEEPLTTDAGGNPTSVSSDGRFLAFWRIGRETGTDIWILPLNGERTPQPWLQTPANEAAAVFSPDGRWLAYVSNESGRYEVYLRPFSGAGRKIQISSEGGGEPVWAPSGKELFYRNGDKLMSVPVSIEPVFTVGRPQLLFQAPYQHAGGRFEFSSVSYDVSPDGKRFLMLKRSERPQLFTQINVVLNWFEELKQRVGR